jgi:MFS transporter, MHS family, proline/betaine transporter
MNKVVAAASFGNALEWFEYVLYAQFATIIAKNFFPESDIAEIMTMAVFATGFFARPLGAIVFGNIGDRYGRKVSLIISIITMALPTAAIGLLPTYETIGIFAPITLVIMRLLQGFSLGGEFSGCIAYVVEHASVNTRGVAGSTAFVSMCVGILFGSITYTAMKYFMNSDDLMTWGWRLPFIGGMFIGMIGLYIRLKLEESPLYKAAKANKTLSSFPLKELLQKNWVELLMGVAIYITVTTPFFISTVYIEKFMNRLGYTEYESGIVSMAILITMIVVFPISAKISDHIGRKPILFSGACGIAILTWPVFWITGEMNFNDALLAQIVYAGVIAWYMGPVPTVLVELFPTRIRLTGVALSYNLSAAVFGGTAPMVAMLLHRWSGNPFSISYYIIVLAIFTLFILRSYVETYKNSLVE